MKEQSQEKVGNVLLFRKKDILLHHKSKMKLYEKCIKTMVVAESLRDV
jgi:hypothetical protein